MKFRTKPSTFYDNGDRRVIHKFLWLPDFYDHEWRWLEWAYVIQEYTFVDAGYGMHGIWMSVGWKR